MVGRPDDRWGERPVVFASLHEGRTLEIETVRNRLEHDFESWQRPDELLIVESIPSTSTAPCCGS